MKAFFVTIPHSGERIPEEAQWLRDLPEPILMRDVDRFVDRLYLPALQRLTIPFVQTEWHRYAADLNRVPSDIDADAVVGAAHGSGTHPTGFHWVVTTQGEPLMKKPIARSVHEQIVQKYFEPWHARVREMFTEFEKAGATKVFQLDAHSMPSMGTDKHRDPGEKRAEIVVSDQDGKSCEPRFRELVGQAYSQAGFEVQFNWPYKGGRVTQTYGRPEHGHHTIQVELNRDLYMNEETREYLPEKAQVVGAKIEQALSLIQQEL